MREDFSLKKLSKCLVGPISSEKELISLIHKLKKNFTTQRSSLEDYLDNQKMISAYTLFYMTTNIPKFSFIYDQLPVELQEIFKSYDFIDFGTGPGTYILAHHLQVGSFQGFYYGVEQSKKMLKQANQTLPFFGIAADQFLISDQLPERKRNKRILFFGNTLNEMSEESIFETINKVSPEVLFFLEPGTKDSFKKILKIRKFLFEKDYDCLFPCPGAKVSCPMEEGDWCHQVFKYTHNLEIQRLSQLVKLDRSSMPLIAHIYSQKGLIEKKAETFDDQKTFHGFMVRKFKDSKHSFRWQLCLDDSDMKGLYMVEFYKKKFNKNELKKLKDLSTGMKINFQIEKILGPKLLRISLEGGW